MKSAHAITPGKLLVLSGPGGVGKSTVAKKLREIGDFWVSISHTTREPRVNEIDGRDYNFVSHEVFQTMINNGEFLEWAEFAGNRYGTTQDKVEQALLLGKNVLLEIEIEGAKQVKAHLPKSILVFLEPPSWEELVARLEGRGTDDEVRRAERLELAQEELEAAASFDVVLINDDVDGVVKKLIELAS
jgi:guanylate kinase